MGGRGDALSLYAEVLDRQGLITTDSAGVMSCPWRFKVPFKPSEDCQKLIIAGLQESLMMPQTYEQIVGWLHLKRPEDIKNALDWLVLNGYAHKTVLGYTVGYTRFKS